MWMQSVNVILLPVVTTVSNCREGSRVKCFDYYWIDYNEFNEFLEKLSQSPCIQLCCVMSISELAERLGSRCLKTEILMPEYTF